MESVAVLRSAYDLMAVQHPTTTWEANQDGTSFFRYISCFFEVGELTNVFE